MARVMEIDSGRVWLEARRMAGLNTALATSSRRAFWATFLMVLGDLTSLIPV